MARRARKNSIKGKAAAKAAGRFVPGAGEVLMVLDGTPVAVESIGRVGKTLGENMRRTKDHAKNRRYKEAVASGMRGGVSSMWEATKGVGKTTVAVLVAREAADAIDSKAKTNSSGPRRYTWRWPVYTQRAVGNPQASDVGLFQDVLAHLRALQWVYWTEHWTSAGDNFYGDHLLLERLYTKDITAQIDALGERIVAYFGPEGVDPEVVGQRAQALVATFKRQAAHPMFSLLLLEDDLQESVRKAWSTNATSAKRSLGLDNFLAGLADARDEARYLLGRRMRQKAVSNPRKRTPAQRAGAHAHMLLDPKNKSWPVHDRRHACIAIDYMRKGRGLRSRYPTYIRRLAEFWPPDQRANSQIWSDYERNRATIERVSGRAMPELKESLRPARRNPKENWLAIRRSGSIDGPFRSRGAAARVAHPDGVVEGPFDDLELAERFARGWSRSRRNPEFSKHTAEMLDSYPEGTIIYAPPRKMGRGKPVVCSAKKRNGNWDIYTSSKPEQIGTYGHTRGTNEGTWAPGVVNFWLGEDIAVHQLGHARPNPRKRARKNGSTKGPYDFVAKAEQYANMSLAELQWAVQDAELARKAMIKIHDDAASNWYSDDVHTIAAEIKKRGYQPMLRNPSKKQMRGGREETVTTYGLSRKQLKEVRKERAALDKRRFNRGLPKADQARLDELTELLADSRIVTTDLGNLSPRAPDAVLQRYSPVLGKWTGVADLFGSMHELSNQLTEQSKSHPGEILRLSDEKNGLVTGCSITLNGRVYFGTLDQCIQVSTLEGGRKNPRRRSRR